MFVLLPLHTFNPIPFQVEISFYPLPFLSLAYLTLLSPTLFIFSSTSSLDYDSNSCWTVPCAVTQKYLGEGGGISYRVSLCNPSFLSAGIRIMRHHGKLVNIFMPLNPTPRYLVFYINSLQEATFIPKHSSSYSSLPHHLAFLRGWLVSWDPNTTISNLIS